MELAMEMRIPILIITICIFGVPLSFASDCMKLHK